VAVDVEDETGTSIRVFGLPELREIPVPRPAAIGVASSVFGEDNEANLDPAATVLRFHFSNPLVPQCVYDFDVTTGALSLRKQDPVSLGVIGIAMCSISSVRLDRWLRRLWFEPACKFHAICFQLD